MEWALAWIWFKNNWRIVGLSAALLALSGMAYFLYETGKEVCQGQVIVKTITKTITIRGKQNEIRDNRPDTKRVAKRMLSGTF